MRIIHSADWHLGHARTHTVDTVRSIRQYLFPQIPGTDIMYLAGDVTDGTITMDSKNSRELIRLYIDLLYKLAEHKVKLRVLRGTISHDRTQLDTLTSLVTKINIPVDVKVINQPLVETIVDLGISILYLPDDLPYKNKRDLFKHIKSMLIAVDGQVDHVVMHGIFDYTCYGFQLSDAYTLSQFDNIVTGWIFCGHVHTPKVLKNSIYAGSFDRLAHGEEHAKGFYVIDNGKPEFIENKSAIKFITKQYHQHDVDAIYKYHDKVMKLFDGEKYGYLRVILPDVQLRQSLRSYHTKKYSHIQIKFKTEKKKTTKKLAHKKQVVLEIPTKANLGRLVYTHVKTKGIELKLKPIQEALDGL